MNFELSIINGKSVLDIIRAHRAECIDVGRNAYLAHARGESVNPESYFLRFPDKPDCRIIALPAYLGDGFGVAGLKWIASYPGNVQRGFPRASAVLVLNNYEIGYPFAILESSIISAARTAASATLAAYWLSGQSRRAHSLGIVGAGFIARYIYDFLVDTGWAIEEVRLYDRSPLESEKFRNTVCRPEHHRTVTVVPDVAQLLRASDLIVFTTVASTPHIADATLFEHNPVVLHISLRDLAPEILLRSQNVVDDVEHVSADSHFFDDLGADSLGMAHFCARVRKRGDLPSVSMKDIYRHPTIRSLAAALADSASGPAQPPVSTAIEAATPTSTREYI